MSIPRLAGSCGARISFCGTTSLGTAVVYLHPNGRDYLAVDADGAWWRWPAERGGWSYRQRHEPPDDESFTELPSRLADLALRLSGVRR